MTIILVGAVIVVVGGLVGAIGSYLHNKRSSEKTERIIQLQSEVIQLSQKLSQAQDELLKYTSGGDSFGEVQLLRISDGAQGYLYMFYFKKHGQYPLYNVTLTALDRKSLDKERLKANNYVASLEDLKNYKSFQLGDIDNADGGISFGELIRLENGVGYDYLFTVTSRNLTFSQVFKFRVNGDKLATATRITTPDNAGNVKILLEKVDSDYPVASDEGVDWN